MAPLLMFDSTDVNAIPLSAKMVLGYLDGARIPSTIPALKARFPHLTPVVVCVTAQQNGAVLDVENGDARPSDAPGWAQRQRGLGNPDPIVYCSTSVWPTVKAAFAVQNVPLPWWFEAHYDNVAVLSTDPRAVAKQYANAKITGSNLDISLIGPNWPGLKPSEDDGMYLAQGPTVGIWIVDGGKATHIPDMPDVEAYQAAGTKLIPLSDALIAALSA